MFFRSVRFKMLLWYIVFLAVTLSIFSVILYGGFRTALYDDLDDLLSSRAEGVTDSINAYWQAKKMEASHASKMPAVPDTSDHENFIKIASQWVEEKRKDPDLTRIFVYILDAKGGKILSSRNATPIDALDAEDLKDILNGEDDFSTILGQTPQGKKEKFRIYTKPVVEDGSVTYIVQVGGPIKLLSLALSNLRFVLFILIPLTILLAAIPGIMLARITLRPVDKMISTLKQITAENLRLKIHIPDTKDEIRRLADTFNEMIERLERSFSSQQRFIQDVSRELKTPMKALKDELESATDKKYSEEGCKALMQKATVQIGEFSKIIENLLVLSLFDNDQLVLSIKKVNLKELVENIVDELRSLAKGKDLAVSLSCPDKIILDADEKQLRQLILNLLDNAIKYTYRNGSIAITAQKGEGYAKVIVSDTGIGIPEAEIPYIFDRFYQGSRSTPAKGGFGLGLSSAKSIVEEHRGTITVESKYGKGATFTVSLPLSYQG